MSEFRISMAGGEGRCVGCGAQLLVLNHALARLIEHVSGDADGSQGVSGMTLGDGRLLALASADRFSCPRCGVIGIWTPLAPG